MLQPLAIVFYERVMPGSQLANRLQDMNYRVLVLNNPALIAATVRRESPLIAFLDLEARGDICGAIERIRSDEATAHLPIVAFAPDDRADLLAAAQKAGASLIVGESRLGSQLSQLLEQALHVE
jgi:CheY-like chemotaxis protein